MITRIGGTGYRNKSNYWLRGKGITLSGAAKFLSKWILFASYWNRLDVPRSDCSDWQAPDRFILRVLAPAAGAERCNCWRRSHQEITRTCQRASSQTLLARTTVSDRTFPELTALFHTDWAFWTRFSSHSVSAQSGTHGNCIFIMTQVQL